MATAYLSVGCFGKLPFWPEYMESGVAFGTSRALKFTVYSGLAIVCIPVWLNRMGVF